jgi:hypothetical protein
MSEKTSSAFSLRAVTSLTLTLSFLVVAASSCALFCMKRLELTSILGVSRTDWTILHSVLGCLFLAVLVVHILVNLRSLGQYIRKAFTSARGGTLEMLIAVVLVAGLTATAMLGLPPASWIAKRPSEMNPSALPAADTQDLQDELYDPANDSGATESYATPEQ